MSTPNSPSQSAIKAKRMFVRNLALCTLLVVIFIIHRLNSSSEAEPAQPTETISKQEPQSDLELANITGQAHGLTEDPKAYRRLTETRLTEFAEQAIDLTPETIIKADREALISTYIDGYYARFEEYYSERDGYNAGFLFGLKCNPTIHAMYSKSDLVGSLNNRRSIVEDKYSLDKIQWIVFKQGFIKGYRSGYIQTKEGITAKRSEHFELIEP